QDGDMDDWTCQTDPNKKGNSLFLDSFDQRVCKSFINTVEAELKKSGEDGQLWPDYKTIWYPGCAEDGGVYTWVKQIKDKLLAKKYLSYHEISSELITAIKQSLLGRPGTEERLLGDSSGESAEEFGLGIPNIDEVSEKGVPNNSFPNENVECVT
ncbi:MAG: hypothetical protein VB071_02730, partial [Lawsonibacter sp.]|nr:hypothetical protein [Lawsonibacter sp.]